MGGVSCGLEVTDRRAGDLEVREGEGQGDVEGGARMELWCATESGRVCFEIHWTKPVSIKIYEEPQNAPRPLVGK